MTTMNPFDLLGDNDIDDVSQLAETASAAALAAKKTEEPVTQPSKVAKLPTKPVPPSQAVREAKNETGRGGGRGFGRGGGGGERGRGRGGYNNRDRDYSNNENAFNNSVAPGAQGDEAEGGKAAERKSYGGPRGPYRGGGRRGGFNNEEGRDGERPRRTYERHSGTGRGNEFKREGAGRGNWGNQSDEVAPAIEEVVEETEKNVIAENLPAGEEAVEANKEVQPDEAEEKEPEEKEMTLEEYEKVLEDKRKALLALKPEERKVEVDKDLQSMQQLSNRKDEDPVFIKLGSDKNKKKEATEKERAKKSVSINEFLKPADGEKYYSPGGRGRGRGRGPRGGGGGGGGGGSYGGGNRMNNAPSPIIEDQKQFPTLGAPRA